MSLPFVSCLMPTKNRRTFIPDALRMWAAQDYQGPFELIVIEDGDEDCSDLVRPLQEIYSPYPEYEWKFSRVGYWRYDELFGESGTLGAKLNFAAKRAPAGSILINWDDDDWNAPNRISTQVLHMQASGKPFVGFSSLIYYEEGNDYGMEFTGDAWYASGSTHCYTREYALAHPRPDMTSGEDNVAVAQARELDAISTMSGCTCLVARNHKSNTSRKLALPEFQWVNDLIDKVGSDNERKVPLSMFEHTILAAQGVPA